MIFYFDSYTIHVVILYNISRCIDYLTEGEFEGLVAKLSTCHTVAVNYFTVHAYTSMLY